MPNKSKANARRKRLATIKIDRLRSNAGKQQEQRADDLTQKVSYGQPGNLGSGTQLGSAKDEVGNEDQ